MHKIHSALRQQIWRTRRTPDVSATLQGDNEMRVFCLGADPQFGLLISVLETAAGLWSRNPLAVNRQATPGARRRVVFAVAEPPLLPAQAGMMGA